MTQITIPCFSVIDLDKLTSEVNPPALENYPDLPNFEEAFDVNSLRRFYQERESATSLSAFSPRKELFSLDDHYFDQNESKEKDDLISTSPSSSVWKNTAPTSPQSLRSLLSLNSSNTYEGQKPAVTQTVSPRRAQSSQELSKILRKPGSMDIPKKVENLKVVFKNGSMIFSSEKLACQTPDCFSSKQQELTSAIHQTSSNSRESENEIEKALKEEEEQSQALFDKLLRTKKIFKIIKDKPKKVYTKKSKRFFATYRRKKNDPTNPNAPRSKISCHHPFVNKTKVFLFPIEKPIPTAQSEDVYYSSFINPNHHPKRPIISFMN